MTAQIPDSFRYRGHEYAIAGISTGKLFDPATLGLEPRQASTACWRGYEATFAIREDRLVLAELRVHLQNEDGHRAPGPPIAGVEPATLKDDTFGFNNAYRELAVPIEYTGGILLGRDFIQSLYLHMGFHPAWKFKEVLELLFDQGRLIGEHDRSAAMAEVRAKLPSNPTRPASTATKEEIRAFVERCFDQSYGR